MPIYEAVCLKCGKYHEYIRKTSNSGETPLCCGSATSKRILSAPMAQFDIQHWDAYESPATGKLITSKAERRADMKVSGCRDWEGMESEKKEAAKRKAKEEEETDRQIDHAVRQAWSNLSPSKKAQALKEAGA